MHASSLLGNNIKGVVLALIFTTYASITLAQDITGTVYDAQLTSQCTDGSIDLSVNAGFAPFEFAWVGPNYFNDVEDIDNLLPGVYSVSVTDALCGTATASFTVGCDEIFVISYEEFDGTQGECNDGWVTISVVGGQPPYTYIWKTCQPQEFQWPVLSTTNTVDGLEGGSYCVTITDSNNETLLSSYDIDCDCPEKPNLDLIADVNEYCDVSNKGGILIPFDPTGYIVNWYGPNGFWDNSISISSLNPGHYQLVLSHGDACNYSYGFDIPNDGFTIDETILEHQLEGDGAILLQVLPNQVDYSGDFEFEWSNGATSQNIYELDEEEYSVTVTNELGCSIVETYEIDYVNCNFELVFDVESGDNGEGYGNWSCNLDNSLVINEISGGSWPYYLHIDETDPEADNYEQTFEFNAPFQPEYVDPFVIPDIRGSRYTLTLTDFCGNILTQEIDLCAYCGYEYDPVSGEFVLFDGGIRIKNWCLCDGDECPGDDEPFLEIFVTPELVQRDYEVKIIWPNGSFATIIESCDNTGDPNDLDLTYQSPHGYVLGAKFYELTALQEQGEPFEIRVIRYDLCTSNENDFDCRFAIPVEWPTGEAQYVIFNDNGAPQWENFLLSNGTHVNDYYFGNWNCKGPCTPTSGDDEDIVYQTDESLCDENMGFLFFQYLPEDDMDPCGGGGTLQAFYLNDNGVVVSEPSIEVPDDIPFEHITNNWVGSLDPVVLCSDGGGCVFNSLDIEEFGIALDKPILAQYCEESDILPDADEDGNPDITDPCPNHVGHDCEEGGNTGGGGMDDECDIVNDGDCTFFVTCGEEDTETVTGDLVTNILSGYFEESACWYCFEATYCQVLLSDGSQYFELIGDPISQLYVSGLTQPEMCNPNLPSSCTVKIYCDQDELTPNPAQHELMTEYCHPDCSDPVDYPLPLCSSGEFEDILSSATSSSNTEEIAINVPIDRELAIKIIAESIGAQPLQPIAKTDQFDFTCYPNPTENQLILELTNTVKSEVKIELMDVMGGSLLAMTEKLNPGRNIRDVSLNPYPAGVYIVKVEDTLTGIVATKRILKQ